MGTANEEYQDSVLRYQIALLAYSRGICSRVARLLELADLELGEKLRKRLAQFEGRPVDFTSKRWQELLTDIQSTRAGVWRQYRLLTRPELMALGPTAAAQELSLLEAAIPVDVSFASVDLPKYPSITLPELQAQEVKEMEQALKLLEAAAPKSATAARELKALRAAVPRLAETAQELKVLEAATPVKVRFTQVELDQLRAIVLSRPFQGRLLKDWYKGLEAADQRRLRQAIQLGMAEGESVDQIVRRIVGTRKKRYADGGLAISRRDAQAVVRTAVNHVSNKAREQVWEANSDITPALIWVATLDGRTTPICRARDGRGAPVGGNELPPNLLPLTPPGARPPAHFNCRSTMAAYIDGVGLVGQRPFVVGTRTPKRREIDFRAEARRTGRPIQDIRAAWAAKHIGRVPARTTYQEFLFRQTASFQDEVLGPTRGKLFRTGGLKVYEFVDRGGNQLTLAELADARPGAFIKAGLDPAEF